MKNIAIIGATGITGVELTKILASHREIKIKYLIDITTKEIGEKITNINVLSYKPELVSTSDNNLFALLQKDNIDLIFLCLPHKISMEFVKQLYEKHKDKISKIIDLSADFRIKNVSLYEKFYKTKHLLPQLLKKFVYGLPEIKKFRDKIKQATFVANPGCYPTSVILGLAPIVKEVKEVIIDAKSGYSGGGKKLVEEYESYGGNNTYPYSVSGEHRHIPEIEEKLSLLAKKNIKIIFTPYVVPQYQGMLTTIYVKVQSLKFKVQSSKFKVQSLYEMYKKYYKKCPFIKILPVGELPRTKNVINTNFCEIGFAKEENSNWVKIFVAIDNLIKGAVGQAVQNMNLMFGFDETEGLV